MIRYTCTDRAPKAVGPYHQAVGSSGFLFSSGQIGVHPVTGVLADGIENQTKQVMENLKYILWDSAMDFSNVVKTTVYLQNMDDVEVVNSIYGSYFGELLPARSLVAVSSLPKGALIEVDLVATRY